MIFFPTIGTKLNLNAEWKFRLYQEYRNRGLVAALKITDFIIDGAGYYRQQYQTVTLSPGTILRIDRVYIRQGQSEFDSITFIIVETPMQELKGKKRLRFWAKIKDINGIMDAEVID